MENEIEELLKNLKAKPNKRIRPSIDAQTYLNHVKTNTSLDPVEQLQKEIEKDFGIRVDDEGIVSNAEKWQFVEQKVNEQVLGQKEFVHQLILGFKRPYVLHHSLEKPLNHLLVIGKKGSGKHAALDCINEIGYQNKVLNHKKTYILDFSKISDEKLFFQDFYEASQSLASIIIFDHLEQCPLTVIPLVKEFVSQGVLSLNKRYAIQKNQLVEANQMLLSQAIRELTLKNKYCVYMSHQSLQALSNTFGMPFIQSFKDVCITQEVDETTKKEIVHQQISNFKDECEKRFMFTCVVDDSFVNYLEHLPLDGLSEVLKQVFDALGTFKLKQVVKNNKITLSYENTVLVEVDQTRYDLFEVAGTHFKGETMDVKKELEEIVGLKEVKDYVLSLEQNVKLQQRRLAQGLKRVDVSMHMIFMGNPGTGKTTIARIISRYLKTMGVIKSGQLVEVTRADLVGQYVGHTAPLTTKVIESALGGVLFIDEAYSLYRGKEDSFGLEAIDTLVKAMEDYRDQLIVVLAGYSKEMNAFLEANSGLKSRFPNIIHFADYTADELVAITQRIAKGKDYVIHEESLKPLHAYYEKVQSENARENGNGRLARNVVEQAILRQATRCMKDSNARLDELQKEDFNF